MAQTVIKIGNSAGVILPQSIREENNIQIGDTIDFTPTGVKGKIVLAKTKNKTKKPTITTKFAQMVDEFMTEHEDVLRELAGK